MECLLASRPVAGSLTIAIASSLPKESPRPPYSAFRAFRSRRCSRVAINSDTDPYDDHQHRKVLRAGGVPFGNAHDYGSDTAHVQHNHCVRESRISRNRGPTAIQYE